MSGEAGQLKSELLGRAASPPDGHRRGLHKAQASVFRSAARFIVLVAGRRFGKTWLAVLWLLAGALEGKGQLCFYIFPTFRQAKQVAWRLLKELSRPWASVVHETDLSIELMNGSIVALRGVDKPDSLRGVGPNRVVFDEYQDIDPAAWVEVIRPAIANTLGRVMFVGTPKGWGPFKDLYDEALVDASGQWAAFRFTTLDGGNVPPGEVEAARAQMDARTFRQEFEASFESVEGRVYYAFNRELHPAGNVVVGLKDTGGPLLVGMDFNVDPMSAVYGVKVGPELHLLGEVVLPNSNTFEMAAELRRRFPQRQIIAYPDPSGRARKTSAMAGETDFTILRGAGFSIVAPKGADAVVDRVNDVNAMLQDATGARRLLIDPACKRLIYALDGLIYKEGTKQPDKSGGLDHITDALGYLVAAEFSMVRRTGVKVEGLRR